MKKVLYALLVATICVACDKEGDTSETNPVGTAISQFSPEYGQVTRAAGLPWTVEGTIRPVDNTLVITISGEYTFAQVLLNSETKDSQSDIFGEPVTTISTKGHSGHLDVTILIEGEWKYSANFNL